LANPKEIAQSYFELWQQKDFESLRKLLADDVTFNGPLAQIEGADGCIAGIMGLSEITTDISISKMVADECDVMTWFVLHTGIAPPTPVVNWTYVKDGKIQKINVTFDPRGILGLTS
jgi:hypothetical protein